MTNAEAIFIINNRLNTYYCTDEDLQALELAIKALEARPQGENMCVTCKYRLCEITEKPCRECSRSWADLYEKADMKGGAE